MAITSTLIHQFLEQSAREHPDKCALVDDKTRATYVGIDAAANNLAAWLITQNVGRGDRVVLLLANGLEYVVSYYAILKVGAVVVPLNPELKSAGLKPILTSIKPKVVILSGKQHGELCRTNMDAFGIEILLFVGDEQPPASDCRCSRAYWQKVVETGADDSPNVAVDAADLASIIFTSGSTGVPKGVMLTHRNIVANAASIISYLHLTRNDVQMVVLPFFYVMGKSLLNTHFAVGGRVVINNRFAFPATVVKQMAEEKVTGFSGVPSTYAHLLHKSPLAGYRDRLGSLRYCSQAGGHMARATKESLLRVLPDKTELYVMYGATEAAARLSYVEPGRLVEKIDSIGRPIPGVSMKIIGSDGAELPPGEVGEVVATGDNITSGYWRDLPATRAVLSPDGYHTGDLGYRDQDGYFFLTGRKDQQLKVGGHRINPVEIEETLMATGLVVEASVLGIPDRLLGNRLVAIVAAAEPAPDARKILSLCAKNLPKHKLPQDVLFVKSLPKNGAGKVDKKSCEALFASSMQTVTG